MQWYYMKEGQQTGPVDDKAFQAMVQSGEIGQDISIWNEEMPEWAPYSTVDDRPRLRINKRELAKPSVGQALGRVDPDELVRNTAGKRNAEKKEDEDATPYGGFWRRWLASIIDGIILNLMAIFFVALGVALKMFVYKDTKSTKSLDLSDLELPPDVELPFDKIGYSDQELYIALGLAAVCFLSIFFYKPYWTGKTGSTLGKKMMKIKVVRSSGGPVTAGRAFGRYCAEVLSGMIMSIGYLMAGFDKQKRALHDRIADTRVVRF